MSVFLCVNKKEKKEEDKGARICDVIMSECVCV